MTTTNSWPGKPGVPLNPEQDGQHWVKSVLTGEMYLFKWKAEKFYSCGQPQILPHWVDHPMWQVKEMIYLGPVLMPDEVKNLRDDLASAERERAHQHGRAERNAAEHAREQAKREALQKRVAELEGALRAYPRFTEIIMTSQQKRISILEAALADMIAVATECTGLAGQALNSKYSEKIQNAEKIIVKFVSGGKDE